MIYSFFSDYGIIVKTVLFELQVGFSLSSNVPPAAFANDTILAAALEKSIGGV